MSFRRTRRIPRGTGRREPVQWFRQQSDFESDDPGDPVGVDIFAPTTMALMVPQDFRCTALRIKIALGYHHTQQVNFSIQMPHWVFGVAVLGTDEQVPDPTLQSDSDLQVDWLYLGVAPISAHALSENGTVDSTVGEMNLDIKAKRKVDADQRIVVCARYMPTLVTPSSSPGLHIDLLSSVLWQRTLR